MVDKKQDEVLSIPARGNRPVEARILGMEQEMRDLRTVIHDMVLTMQSAQKTQRADQSGGVAEVFKALFEQQRSENARLMNTLLNRAEERTQEQTTDPIEQLAKLGAVLEDDRIGGLLQKLTGQQTDWGAIIDRALDRLAPQKRPENAIGRAQAVAGPEPEPEPTQEPKEPIAGPVVVEEGTGEEQPTSFGGLQVPR